MIKNIDILKEFEKKYILAKDDRQKIAEAYAMLRDIIYFREYIRKNQYTRRFNIDISFGSNYDIRADALIKKLLNINNWTVLDDDVFVTAMKVYDITQAIFNKMYDNHDCFDTESLVVDLLKFESIVYSLYYGEIKISEYVSAFIHSSYIAVKIKKKINEFREKKERYNDGD